MTQERWEIQTYEDEERRCPFNEWLSTLDAKMRTRVDDRLDRLEQGNFGDYKSLGDGLYELRFFFGSGFRIYYAMIGKRVVLLIGGGSKKGQSRDIKVAKTLWNRYESQ